MYGTVPRSMHGNGRRPLPPSLQPLHRWATSGDDADRQPPPSGNDAGRQPPQGPRLPGPGGLNKGPSLAAIEFVQQRRSGGNNAAGDDVATQRGSGGSGNSASGINSGGGSGPSSQNRAVGQDSQGTARRSSNGVARAAGRGNDGTAAPTPYAPASGRGGGRGVGGMTGRGRGGSGAPAGDNASSADKKRLTQLPQVRREIDDW